MKGFSAILVVIILIIILVSMFSLVYIWSTKIFTSAQTPAISLVNKTITEIGGDLRIVSMTNTTEKEITIYIKNVGNTEIDLNNIILYLDDERIGFNC